MFDCAVLQILVMLCFPLFSYAGVIGTASGMVDLKDMKPLLNRLRPSSRKMMVSNQYSSILDLSLPLSCLVPTQSCSCPAGKVAKFECISTLPYAVAPGCFPPDALAPCLRQDQHAWQLIHSCVSFVGVSVRLALRVAEVTVQTCVWFLQLRD